MSTHLPWLHHQLELDNYLKILSYNPYIGDLRIDYKDAKNERFLNIFEGSYKDWLLKLINNRIIKEEWIDYINYNFINNTALNMLGNYIKKIIPIGDVSNLRRELENIESLKTNLNIPKLKLYPSKLKFVTTTAIVYLDTSLDFKLIYNSFKPPENIFKNRSEIIYNNSMIGKVIGCKTGDLDIKGFFKKEKLGDFYNCATVNLVLGNKKTANIKIFKNGKLQMTGIPHPDDGKIAVKYICNYITELTSSECKISLDNNSPNLKSYDTVMMNTCYVIGYCINRGTLHKILRDRYHLNAIYDTEGYPGVRVVYYYNTNNYATPNEGRCICNNLCKGKGSGDGESNCRKISIAIFQSGSAIIAGGCKTDKPIYAAYNFINNVLGEIIEEVYKPENKRKNINKRYRKYIYIEKDKLKENELYNKLYNKLLTTNINTSSVED